MNREAFNKILKLIDKEVDFYIKTSGILVERKRNEIYEYIRGIITYAYLSFHITFDEYIYISSKLATFYKYENYLIPKNLCTKNRE